ncbi:MAG TPA: hypothetical protein VGO45_07020 [Bacteroidia bacterium]|nr:hypothetical protein [Bacteroidia bacterium]
MKKNLTYGLLITMSLCFLSLSSKACDKVIKNTKSSKNAKYHKK